METTLAQSPESSAHRVLRVGALNTAERIVAAPALDVPTTNAAAAQTSAAATGRGIMR
jgi:hypothetical protein